MLLKTTKNQRGNSVDTYINTYRSQNYLLNPKNKSNIFNYYDNLNYVLDKHDSYRHNYHKGMIDKMNFHNFSKDSYYANIFDKDWYDFGVQMAYMLDAKYINNYLARWLVNDYKNMSFSSAKDAALVVYSDYFNKLPYDEESVQERTAKAEETYNSLSKQDSPFVSRICNKVDRYLDYAEPYDANGDKFLNIMDVTDLQRSLAEFPDVDINLAVCDADGDGRVMVDDVTEMQRVIAGMVDDLSV